VAPPENCQAGLLEQQISGAKDVLCAEPRSYDEVVSEMIAMDLHYTENKSLWLDLKILMMTIPALLSQLKATRLPRQQKTLPQAALVAWYLGRRNHSVASPPSPNQQGANANGRGPNAALRV
jgi:hypothetical protein